jgi:hypothetical protein
MSADRLYQPACSSCRFFAAGHERREVSGECRKHTPRVARDGRAQWPATKSNDWCGEFERRE